MTSLLDFSVFNSNSGLVEYMILEFILQSEVLDAVLVDNFASFVRERNESRHKQKTSGSLKQLQMKATSHRYHYALPSIFLESFVMVADR